LLGGEFKGYCQTELAKRGILHYTTQDTGSKVGTCERAIKVVKSILFKILSSRPGFKDWPSLLEDIRLNYNQRPNRAMEELTTNQAAKAKNRPKVMWYSLGRRLAHRPYRPFKLEVGNLVRIQNYSGTFGDKGQRGYHSQVLYRILSRQFKAKVPAYRLEEALSQQEIRGSFYEPELVKVAKSLEKGLKNPGVIFGYRVSPQGVEEIQVKKDKGREWVPYSQFV